MGIIEREPTCREEEPDELAMQTITSLKDLETVGLTVEDVWSLCRQVSEAVNNYNSGHPSEMLRKTPEILFAQLASGLSVLIFHRVNGELEFLYHGSIYPAFEDGEEYILGTQIVELGTSIANEKYRGRGLGTKGLEGRLNLMQQFASDKRYGERNVGLFGMSTVKRVVTARVFNKLEVHPSSYWEIPYVSYLTDTCESVSERFGHDHCKYRRGEDESTDQAFRELLEVIGPSVYIPCTLIITDKSQAVEFNAKMQRLNQEWLGESINPGDISVESYKVIGRFYEEVKRRAISANSETL